MLALDDPTTLALVGTWVVVVGVLAVWFWQTRQARRLDSARALLELKDRFDGLKMRTARKALAHDLLDRSISEVTTVDVPVFFELIGALTHRGALDESLVWSVFGGWITNYYYALSHPTDYIGRSRESFGDASLFAEFEWLNGRMLRLDARHRAAATTARATEESQEILRHELGLEAAA